MTTYKLTLDPITKQSGNMVFRSDGVWISKDPANTDYQAYLAWVAEGNTPEPADEGTQ
jgi:hypothetical protein